jgi:predicted MFS family arabinose efflux permease
MIFALVFGLLMERVSKNKVLISIFILTLVGCVLMNFAPSPSSPLTFVFMVNKRNKII